MSTVAGCTVVGAGDLRRRNRDEPAAASLSSEDGGAGGGPTTNGSPELKPQLERSPAKPPRPSRDAYRDVLPVWASVAQAVLCFFLVAWTVGYPGSMLVGRVPGQQQRIDWFLNATRSQWRPQVMKYHGHPMVQATHQLPGAIWAALAPFQLSSSARRRFPAAHRWCGRLFLLAAATLLAGLVVIYHRKLSHHHDYPGHVIPDAFTGADTAVLSAWFAGTAAYALACIARGNVAAHQTWMARHVASGVWVSFQRLMTLALPALDLDLGLVDFSLPVNRFRGLQWGAYFSVAVYTTVMELAMRQQRSNRAH